MNQVLDFPQLNLLLFNRLNCRCYAFHHHIISSRKSRFHRTNLSAYYKQKCSAILSSSSDSEVIELADHSLLQEDADSDGEKFIEFPHVQSLRNFPKEELFRKVVMVRFDAVIFLYGMKKHESLPANAFSTIKYLYELGAKVILVGSWNENRNSRSQSKPCLSIESVADFLSSMLELEVVPVKHVSEKMHSDVVDNKRSCILLLENLYHVKGERANCLKFSEQLASGVDIIVNDAFSECHKVLASTVGVASFCDACVAGFYFEEGIYKLKKIINSTARPYVAIIGGGNLADKAAAVQFLATICDGLVFVGKMAFQIMHALGVPVPNRLVEPGALKEAVKIVEYAKSRNIPLCLPRDVWCIKDHIPNKMEIVSVYTIREGWQPVDIGPSSLEKK